MDILGNARLRLRHRAAEVAAANTELDGYVTLGRLVIDERRTRIHADVGEFAQRNEGGGAGRRLISDWNIADLFDAVAVPGVQTHRQVELPIALEHRRSYRTGHGCLDHGVHIAGIEPVAGGPAPIHLDVEVRLADDVKNPEILHALDLLHFLEDPRRVLLQ